MVGNVGLWPAETFVWTRVSRDLRNEGPPGMLSIAKPIKIKVLLHQFSLLMFNLHYMRLFTAFLPDHARGDEWSIKIFNCSQNFTFARFTRKI